jgi:hypothetical protein
MNNLSADISGFTTCLLYVGNIDLFLLQGGIYPIGLLCSVLSTPSSPTLRYPSGCDSENLQNRMLRVKIRDSEDIFSTRSSGKSR